MAMKSFGPSLYETLAKAMTETFEGLKPQELTPSSAGSLLQEWVWTGAKAILPMLAVIMAVGVIVGLLQGQFLFSWKAIVPDFGRINPARGLGRIFSTHTVVEQFKGLIKLSLVGWIAYADVIKGLPQLMALFGETPAYGVAQIVSRAVSGLQRIGFGILALGVLDYGYQFWEFQKSLRMTKQEVKQEHKQQEGNPELKQKQRQRAREMARRRKALKDVPTADVVVTNPTHYAVAIVYKADENNAPKVVAKGSDLLAQRIKAIAREHDVPTVENRLLARSLYATVDVGKTVPPELYQAVAEVLAYVYSIRRQKRHERSS